MELLRILLIVSSVTIIGLFVTKKLGIIDKPGRDIAARKPVPTLQGVFLYISLIVVILMVYPQLLANIHVQYFLYGAGALMLLSCIDEGLSLYKTNKLDLDHLVDVIPSRVKLLLQVIIIITVVVAAGLHQWDFMRSGQLYQLPGRLGVFLALAWFLLFINAINWFDYAHGQASGLSVIGFLTIAILLIVVVLPYYTGISTEKYEMLQVAVSLSIILAIISLVYTVVEYKPLGLLRDAGVMIYGFALAYLSLLGGAKIGTIVVALSLPLFDAIRVICHRIFVLKKNPLKGDYTHLHHRLLALGWSKGELRGFIWGRSVVMMLLVLLQGTNRVNKVILFGLFATIYFGVNAYLFRYKKLPTSLVFEEKG